MFSMGSGLASMLVTPAYRDWFAFYWKKSSITLGQQGGDLSIHDGGAYCWKNGGPNCKAILSARSL